MEAEGAAAATHPAALTAAVTAAGAHSHSDLLAAGTAHAGAGTVDNARGHPASHDHPTACSHADAGAPAHARSLGAAGGPRD